MAEVPEVETLVRDLREAVVGRTIRETEVLLPAAVRFPTVEEFTTSLTNRLVLDAQRRAKYMLLSLSGDEVLAIHLALWGTIALVPVAQSHLPETLIIWHLDQDEDLRFVDKLGYARAALGHADVLAERLDLKSLGPEALDPNFDVNVLARQLNKRRGVIKSVLLNQRILAGLGKLVVGGHRSASFCRLADLRRINQTACWDCKDAQRGDCLARHTTRSVWAQGAGRPSPSYL
jgi:formamidopyrimidine-DNA glycosylase